MGARDSVVTGSSGSMAPLLVQVTVICVRLFAPNSTECLGQGGGFSQVALALYWCVPAVLFTGAGKTGVCGLNFSLVACLISAEPPWGIPHPDAGDSGCASC